TGAHKAVEIGTLAGYSGTWLARALPDDGKLWTLEVSSKHAAVARANFERAGLSHKVELLEGPALDSLKKIEPQGPFDFVFIGADRPGDPQSLERAVDKLRPGGMVTAQNAWRGWRVLVPSSEEVRSMVDFNRLLADDDLLSSTILAIGEGMAAGIKK